MLYLSMIDEGGSDDIVEIESLDEVESEIHDWVNQGEWNNQFVCIRVSWEVTDEQDELVACDTTFVDVEVDHDILIKEAGGDVNCEHEWSSEGEGGCKENPGVWSVGGTAMLFMSHCIHCGLKRKEHWLGSQRNPGENNSVEYSLPDND